MDRAPGTIVSGFDELAIGRIGFGAAAIGGLYRPVDEDSAQAALTRAWERGIRYFDTAPHYGAGLSEERLGRFLAGRSDAVVSTKVGRLLVPGHPPEAGAAEGFYGSPDRVRQQDFSRDGVLRSVEDSLGRLGLDRIDVLYIHDPDDHEEQALREAYPALAELRAQGAVRAIGVGMNTTRIPVRFVRETDLDCVLVAGRYTLLDRSAADELLPLCRERGVAVVGAGVYNSGLLADPSAGATYDYAEASSEQLATATRMARVCARRGVSLRAAALGFSLSHPAVRTVLIGMRSVEEVDQNLTDAAASIPPGLWDELFAEGA
ncbi:aldo/keto reductase [Pseudonocardia spinosispora]|uniref:aldo/keto reductase n=1 Tax=Pseudonocardia spinosispora TaxID=103441 RepID=UPI0003FCD228|nr:aldo/keto reductase [Pseudonocardia spinosispora]